MSKYHLAASLPIALALSVSACGGGSSGSSDTDSVDSTPVNIAPVDSTPVGATPTEQPDVTLLTGRFVDSAVAGLQFSTDTQSGTTDADGTFTYAAGEDVTFSIGDIVLPPVEGADVITPLDVFGTDNIGDPSVMNLARLLQTLDVDGNADNGIVLGDNASASATGLTVDFASPNFDASVVNLVANSGSTQTSLIGGEPALDHLQETLFDEGIVERPQAPVAEAPVGEPTPGNSSTHPLVGTSAVFSNFAHDIAGTLTILDDRTLQVTNFSYDGGGPSVFFYTGTDGDYRTQSGGQIIGEMLNGRVFDDETITLTIPANLTLDDFNGISVWCDLFNANFGDAQF